MRARRHREAEGARFVGGDTPVRQPEHQDGGGAHRAAGLEVGHPPRNAGLLGEEVQRLSTASAASTTSAFPRALSVSRPPVWCWSPRVMADSLPAAAKSYAVEGYLQEYGPL